METWLIYVALAFVAGAVFGMTTTASALGGRFQQQPTVIMMETQRQPTLDEARGGCLNIIFIMMMGIGVVVALLVLGS